MNPTIFGSRAAIDRTLGSLSGPGTAHVPVGLRLPLGVRQDSRRAVAAPTDEPATLRAVVGPPTAPTHE